MQKGLLKIVALVTALCLSTPLAAQIQPQAQKSLAQADSLFQKKQYTQALEVYQSVFDAGKYSPAMLLRMAYIHEGLGRLGESLYCLNLYFLATDDTQALKKMEELAKKNNLQGYETDEFTHALAWLQEQYLPIAAAIGAFCIFVLSFMIYERRKGERPRLSAFSLVLLLGILYAHINFSKRADHGIIATAPTYLMSGPSAAASVVAIIGEGHQLQIKGRKDVWLKVNWNDREVWVKENLVRPVRL